MKRAIQTEVFVHIRKSFVMRRLGYSKYRPAPNQIVLRVDEAITEARALIEPKIAYVDTKIIGKNPPETKFEDGFSVVSQKISKLLSKCVEACVFAGTIGKVLEQELSGLWDDDAQKALILDSIGSEAAEELARTIHKWTSFRARRNRMAVTGRFSPGYGDFKLEYQPQILEYTGAGEIGMQANQDYLLFPRKSVTGVIGLYSKE